MTAMDIQEWAKWAVIVATAIGTLYKTIRVDRKAKAVQKELTSNGGSSMKDMVGQMAADLASLHTRMVGMEGLFRGYALDIAVLNRRLIALEKGENIT